VTQLPISKWRRSKLFGSSFDDSHKRATLGAPVNWLALHWLPTVLAVNHFTRLTFSNVASFSGGGGVIFSLGGVQPYLRHKAWTSAPDDHL
jgi:hypothetical protein